MAKKGDGGSGAAAQRAALAQEKLANRLVKQSDPLRESLFYQSDRFLRGDQDVTGLPQYRAAAGMADAQYKRAQDNIIGSTPEGGGLMAALAGLEQNRADTLTGLVSDIGGQQMGRAARLATWGAATGSGGYGAAGGLQAQLAQARAQENAGKAQGMGSAAGAAAGLKLAK